MSKFSKLCENILKKIDDTQSIINSKSNCTDRALQEIFSKVYWITESKKQREEDLDTISRQSKTINMLVNALSDKYEHGLFVYSEDGNIPMVIRNGKELTDNMTTNFSISWDNGGLPRINIEQCAETFDGEEDIPQPLYRH